MNMGIGEKPSLLQKQAVLSGRWCMFVMLIDEVLYMEIRVFREFLNRFQMKATDGYDLFEKYDIWGYIEKCYDMLHMNGDEPVLHDVQMILEKNGAL